MKPIAVGKASVVLFLGLALMFNSLTSSVKKESELKLVQGVPDHIVMTKNSKDSEKSKHARRTLEFDLDGVHVDYRFDQPKYKEVVETINSGTPVKALVDMGKGNDAALFKLTANDQDVLSYDSTVKRKEKSKSLGLYLGLPLAAFGGLWAFLAIKS